MNEIFKFWVKPDTYVPQSNINTTYFDPVALRDKCDLRIVCFDNKSQNWRWYSHSDLVSLFPSYSGYIQTYYSLLLSGGFYAEKNQERLDDFLKFQSSSGLLNWEHLRSWILEYTTRKSSVLVVNADQTIEAINKSNISKVIYATSLDSESWTKDAMGILYFADEMAKYKPIKLNSDDEDKLKLFTKPTKLTSHPGYWYIPVTYLVILGSFQDLEKDLSIFDSDRSRVQLVMETLRVANEEMARDKIPPLILKLKAMSLRDRAVALGISPDLLSTKEGTDKFLEIYINKIKEAKEWITTQLLQNPQQGKLGVMDMAIWDGFEVLPTTGDVQEGIKNAEVMAQSIMANLLGLPESVLGSKGENYANYIKPILQFTQDILIKSKQEYLMTKLSELSKKLKFKFDITLKINPYVDFSQLAKSEKDIAEIGRILVGQGIPLSDVTNWLNEKLQTQFEKTDSTRLIENSLQSIEGLEVII